MAAHQPKKAIRSKTLQRIKLNAAQTRRLAAMLLEPSKGPTERMKRALKTYHQSVISDVNV